jgi:(2Fe-2S) ferredoxin
LAPAVVYDSEVAGKVSPPDLRRTLRNGSPHDPGRTGADCRNEREAQKKFAHSITVCVAAGCMSCQSQAVKDAIDQEIKKQGMGQRCKSKGVGCMGLCAGGRWFRAAGGALYKHVSASDAAEIVASVEGNPVSRLVCRTDVPFSSARRKSSWRTPAWSIRNDIEDYIAANGYSAMMRVITEMTPAQVDRRSGQERLARARRRRLSHRVEVEHGRQSHFEESEIRHLQRR